MTQTVATEPAVVTKEYVVGGLRFRFSEVEEKLRMQGLWPVGEWDVGDVAGGALWERVPVLVHVRGRHRMAHFGARALRTDPSMTMEVVKVEQEGEILKVVLADRPSGLEVVLQYEGFGDVGAVRVRAEARNGGTEAITLEQLLICVPGLGRAGNGVWSETTTVHVANNTWLGEAQWNQFRPSEVGIAETTGLDHDMPDTRPTFNDPLGAGVWCNVGTWTTINYLPMGLLEDRDLGATWFWQIEHTGSWQMVVGRVGCAFYVTAGLPSHWRGDWAVTLQPGERHEAAPVGFGCARGGFEEGVAELQRYRRAACLLKEGSPDAALPLIFNDCLKCLLANPTWENSIPVIETAAAAGSEYYVIDAGWFDPRSGPQCLGDWEESVDRFGEKGLKGLCDYVRSKGMKLGLWAEIECVSAAAKIFKKPDSWFLCSHGHRVMSNDRYFFNFANPEVRAYAHGVMDRLCADYGMKYLKLDYNADAGMGDNQRTASHGEGQVASYRGFYLWLEELRERHPELILENCGSGGQRFDYGLLSRTHLQSTSDTNDHRRYPSILAGSLAAGLPEQMGVWSCPHGGQSDEVVGMNLVTPMLGRWHLSGRVDHLTAFQQRMAHEAVALWKERIRQHLPRMVPFWPTPLRHLGEQRRWMGVGLRNEAGTHAFLNVYRLDAEEGTFVFPLKSLKLEEKARVIFPRGMPGEMELDGRAKTLRMSLPERYSARLIEIGVGM